MHSELRRPQRCRRRGLAAILVMMALAVGAILGWALLSNASIQAQVSGNAAASLSADGTAESGLNLGIYYLLNPDKAPALDNTHTFYPGGTNISLGSSFTGSLDSIVVTQDNSSTPPLYKVLAKASAPASRGSVIVRSASATCLVNKEFVIRHGLLADGGLTLGSSMLRVTVNGDARCDGNLVVNSPSVINGTIYAQGSNTSGWQITPQYPPVSAPSYAQLNLCKSLPGSYTYQGRTCIPDTLMLDYGGGTLTSLMVGLTNPANVYVCSGNRTFTGTTVLNGTLVVPPSCTYLRISGNLRITPKPGMPALIVYRDLQVNGNNRVLRFDGLVWVGGTIASAGGTIAGTDFQVNGALMMGGTAPSIDARMGGSMVINYTSDNVQLPNLSNDYQVPISAKIISYGN